MAYQLIIFDRSEGIGTVTLNRPDQLNALTLLMLQELADVFKGMERDPQVRAIILTGAGKAFCGGEDLRQRAETELAPPPNPANPAPSSQPAFEPFSTTFQDPQFDSPGGGGVYAPSAMPSQSGLQPQLVAEFSPLTPKPVSSESPRTFSPDVMDGSPRPAGGFSPEPVQSNFGNGQNLPSITEQVRRAYNPLIKHIRQIEKPVIAAVNGIAAGTGLGLALACDLRYASERARFMEVSIRVGLLPGSGVGYFLPRLIGFTRALELAFNGDEISSEEAEKLGLVNRVVPGDSLLDEARKQALRLAKGPTRAIGLTKTLMYRAANLNLDQALELEAHLVEEAVRTQDYKEGLRAFLEKRPPNYRGQ